MQVERALTRPEGLKSRPWFRNLIYVADENNGYANMVLPSVNEAIRSGDENSTRARDRRSRDALRRGDASARRGAHGARIALG